MREKCLVPSAWCLVPPPRMAAVPVRRESYQHAPASAGKKAEGKKRRSPCTPFREKGKGKENRRGSSWNRLSRVGARVAAALDADLDAAVLAFGGTAADRRIWAAIAWRVGVEEFHFALMDKLAEDAVDNAARRPAAAFQAFLNARFPKKNVVRGSRLVARERTTNHEKRTTNPKGGAA